MTIGNQVPEGNYNVVAGCVRPDAFLAACPSRGLVARLGEKWAMLVLVAPIIAALSRQVIEDAWREYEEQLRSLGASALASALTLIWDTRFAQVTILLAGFGRAAAEVGAVIIVGGNIDGVTRVMTTTIALETSKGDLPLALGLGIILVSLVLTVNAAAYWVKEAAQHRYG